MLRDVLWQVRDEDFQMLWELGLGTHCYSCTSAVDSSRPSASSTRKLVLIPQWVQSVFLMSSHDTSHVARVGTEQVAVNTGANKGRQRSGRKPKQRGDRCRLGGAIITVSRQPCTA